MKRLIAALSFALVLAADAFANVVVIDNPAGDVRVRIVDRDDLDVRGVSDGQALEAKDVEIERKGAAGVFVRVRPRDGRNVHLEVEIPYQTSVGISTTSGTVFVEGMPAALDVQTETGDLELALPWYSSFLDFRAEETPIELRAPGHLERKRHDRGLLMRHHRRVGREYRGYSDVRVRTGASRVVELREIPIPEESPVKLHWQAPAVLEGLFRARGQYALRRRDDNRADPPRPASADFLAEARLVDLLVHATDKRGRPIVDLEAADFSLLEDGEPQVLRSAQLNRLPLNIVVFLDWSDSMSAHQKLTVDAVEQLAASVREQDAIAVYACFRETLFRFSRLTRDRARLHEALGKLDVLSAAGSKTELRGSSPIWDAAFLAAADEIPDRDRDLNVFLPITDGMDNPSRLSFTEFRRAAREMNMTVYPIVPDSSASLRGDRFQQDSPLRTASEERRSKGRFRMAELAKATGGRVIAAVSPQGIGAAFEEISAELGSAYSLSYSPTNRDHKGEWRSIRVEVDRPGVVLRHRSGYVARP